MSVVTVAITYSVSESCLSTLFLESAVAMRKKTHPVASLCAYSVGSSAKGVRPTVAWIYAEWRFARPAPTTTVAR
jgi:hypothetical protein